MPVKHVLIQWEGFGLTTAEIHHRRPDFPSLLQSYVWREYDTAPTFPALKQLLEFWKRDIEGPLHSVRVAHNCLVGPFEWYAVDGIILLQ